MFAPPVAKPKAKTASNDISVFHRATPFGQRHGDVEQAPMFRPLPQGGASLNAHGTPEQDAGPANMSAKGGPPRPSWNFNVPAYSPGREKPFQMPPLFSAPRLAIQAKLKGGAVDDPLEHEADRVADQVMRMPAHSVSVAAVPPQVSRKCDACEEEEKLQKKPAGPQTAAGEAPGIVHEVLRSPGQPLDAGTRAFMEPRFGHDFSQVQVHTRPEASASADAVRALAYTVGQDIVFARDHYRPETTEGSRLLAHELAHTLQQPMAPRSSVKLPSLKFADEAAEAEAERAAHGVAPVPARRSSPLALARQAVNTSAGGLPKPSSVEVVVLSCSSNDISFFTNQGVFRYPLTMCDLSDGEYDATVTTKGKNIKFDLGEMAPEGVRFRFQYKVEAGQTDPSEFFVSQKQVRIIARTTGAGLPTSPSIAKLSFGNYVDQFADVIYDLDYNKQGTSLSTWLRVRYADGTIIDINIYSLEDKKMSSLEARDAMAQGYAGKGGRIFPLRMNAQTTPRLWAARQAAIEEMEESNIGFMTLAHAGVMSVISVPAMPAGMAPGGGGGPPRANVRPVPRGQGGMPPLPEGAATPASEPVPAPKTGPQAEGAQAAKPALAPAPAVESPVVVPFLTKVGGPGVAYGQQAAARLAAQGKTGPAILRPLTDELNAQANMAPRDKATAMQSACNRPVPASRNGTSRNRLAILLYS